MSHRSDRLSTASITSLGATAYEVPIDQPAADGIFAWDATIVVVTVEDGGMTGLGYTYADASLRGLIEGMLAKAVLGVDALDPTRAYGACSTRSAT